MHPRRKARERVLQGLYSMDISHEDKDKVLADILAREALPEKVQSFIKELFMTCVDKREWCEDKIKSHLQNWDMDRVALLDKLVLVMGICEIYFLDDVPPKVTISEAIEIAKKFSTEESSSFVNGILDAVYKDAKAEKTIVAD